MKVLSHPARIAVFDLLNGSEIRDGDGMTATEISRHVGLSPSATSYHLRAMYKAGFVEPAPDRGDKRERVWQMTMKKVSFQAEEGAPRSTYVAESEIARSFMEADSNAFLRAMENRSHSRDQEAIAKSMNYGRLNVMLSEEENTELIERLMDLQQEFSERAAGRSRERNADHDYRLVHLRFQVFPEIGDQDDRGDSPQPQK